MLKKQSQAVDKAHTRVSTRRLLCSVSVSVLALLVAPSVVHAQANLNWDANGATAGNGGAGTWNTTDPTWSPNADGTSGPYTPWSNATPDNAIFGGTAGTVTLGAPITVHNIIFNTAGYTLAGDTLTLGGVTPTITGTGTINSVIAGTAGLTTGGGVNTLTLSGANTFTGPLTIAHGVSTGATASVILAPGGSLATSAVTIGSAPSSGAILAVLQNGADNQLTNATVTFSATSGRFAYWQLLGTSQSVQGVVDSSGAGVIENTEQHTGFGNGTLTLSGSGTYSFNGFMRNIAAAPGSGTLALIKNGTGTQTLSGGNINYTGATTVNAGVLELRNTTAYTSATTVNSGATLTVTNTANQGMNSAITLNNGATLSHNGLTNGSDFWVNAQATTVASGANVTINQASVANTTGVNKGMFLDGGLNGGGGGATVTINATNAGNAVHFRNNATAFAGTLIVNGIASATSNAGSGIAIGGCTTCLSNADITLNGAMELGDQGLGWGNTAGSARIGALNGAGVMVSNYSSTGGSQIVTLGNTNSNGSFSGAIVSGSGTALYLNKLGAGTQVLSGATTGTSGGWLMASNGTLELATGYSKTVNTVDGLLYIGAFDSTFNNGLASGTGTLHFTGGTFTSTAANVYLLHMGRGLNGVLQMDSGSITGSSTSAAIIGDNAVGTLNQTGGSITLGGNGVFVSNAAGADGSAANFSGGAFSATGVWYNGVRGGATTSISGAADVSVATFNFGHASGTSAGVRTLNLLGGALTSTNGMVYGLGAHTVNLNGGTLRAGSSSFTWANNANVTATIGAGGITLDSQAFTASTAQVLGGAGTLTKIGAGAWTLTGTNTFTGGAVINAGTLQISSDANLGGATGGLTFNGGTLQTTASMVSARGVALTGAGTFLTNPGTTLTLSGGITGTGSLTKQGAGSLVLTGAATHTGGTTISAGTLQLGSGGTTGSILGDVVNNSVLAFNRSNALALSGVISGTGAVQQNGSGTTTLSGVNTYSGGTTLTAGTLSFNSIADLGVASALGTGAITLNPTSGTPILNYTGTGHSSNRTWTMGGATTTGFRLRNTGGGTLTLTGNIAITSPGTGATFFEANGANLELLGVISSTTPHSVSFNSTSGRTITLGNANTFNGTASISNATVLAGVLANRGTASSLGTGAGGSGGIGITSNGRLSYTGAGAAGTDRIWSINTGGALSNDGGGALTLTGTMAISSGTATLGGSFGGANTMSGVISGAGNLAVNTAGTWALTGNNAYSGATTITAGTLQVGNGGTSGTLGAGAVTNDAALVLNRSDLLTVANAIGGTGSLTQLGAGTSVLTGANTYAGATTISAGTLQIGNGGTTGALGTGAVTNNAALVLNRSDLLTVAGAIGGTGSLTQLGAGTSVLTGANTYSGPTTISAGTLQIGSGGTTGALGSGATTVAAGANLVFNRSDSLVVASAISGAGTLIQQGPDATTLAGASNSIGDVDITGGTLDVDGVLATPTVSMADNTVLNVDGTVQQGPGAAAAITGSAGANTVAVGAAGALLATGDLGDGADLLDVAGTLDTGAGSFDLGLGDDTLTIHDGTTILGTVVGGAGIDTFNTNIALVADLGAVQGFEALSKTGAGVLNVNGPASSDFTTVDVLAGTLNVAAAGSINNVSSATVASGATLNLNGGFGFTAGADTFTVAGVVTGLADIDMLDGDDTFTIQDGADLSGLATAVDGGLGADTLLADIAGTATLGGAVGFETLIKSNLGTFNINGPATSMFDTVLVQGGTLTVGAGAIVDPQSTVVSSGATLTVNGTYNGTLGADTFDVSGIVNGAGVIDLLDGDDVLTLNDGADLSGLANPLDGGAHGAGDSVVLNNAAALTFGGGSIVNFESLQKTNTGAATLTGAHVYSLGTAVTGGVLDVDGGLETSTLAMSDGATVNVDGTVQAAGATQAAITGSAGVNTVTVGAGGTLLATGDLGDSADLLDVAGTLDTGPGSFDLGLGDDTLTLHDGTTILGTVVGGAGTDTFNTNIALSADLGAVQGFETLSKTGAGVLNVNGPASSDFTTVDVLAGTLNVAAAGGITGVNSATVASGATLNVDGGLGFTAGADTFTVAGAVTGTGAVDLLDGDDVLTLNDGANLSGLANPLDGGAHGAGDSVVLNNAAALTFGGGSIVNFEQLTKQNTGTATLTGAHSYAAGVTISAGVLQLGDGGATGSVVGDVLNNGVLAFNRSDNVIFAGTISGAGALSQLGAGATTLTADNTYAGGTTIVAGTLQIGNGGTSGGIVGDVVNGATLAFNRSDVVTFGGVVSGTGSLDQIGAGTTILTGANTYTGGTTIAAGVLQLGDGGATGGVVGDVVNNGTLAFNRSDPIIFAGLISGTGGVSQIGPGVTILTGGNSYAGATAVTAGTLLVNGDQSGAAGATTVALGATLGGIGAIGGDVFLSDGATLAPSDASGPGTLTIDGGLTLAGAALLDYEFGQSNLVGGPLNDLVNVGGDLTLDGTIDVTVTAGGSFDAGIYRVISYSGTLTNNGLALGATPPGSTVSVVTAIAGQVNLANTAGLTLNFWDGAAGPKFDGLVNGGAGTWQNGAGNNNWTETSGTVNASFSDAAFAIFSAAPGTVTVDNSLGAVTTAGMQFASDGYTITGGDLMLAGPQSTVRVGDGTAAGLGFTATIASALTGTAQMVKTDLGTLVLSGTNTYTGGTLIDAGTLRISSDANLGAAGGGLGFDGGALNTTADLTSARAVDLVGAGAVLTDTGTTLTLAGAISGAGTFTKDGAGTLVLTGTNSYAGATTVNAGALFVNGDQSAATGLTSIASSATLGGAGVIGGDVALADGAVLTPGANGVGTLAINGALSLSSGTTLDYQFGQANAAGGGLNDLVNVGGDLVLDGTINVSVPTGGSFGGGVYRVFNYAGALTDNGLALGALPASSDVAVQTAIAGQVNLVNTAGLSLNFWDGAVGPKNNNAINGGDGVWRVGGGNNNWTELTGTVNADYAQDSFAVFAGAPGTVSVDDVGGAVRASALQFAVDGYTLTGDALTLTGPQATVRVGDGTAAGTGYTATIAAELTGAAALVKTDAGTLVLTGANTYTGGTAIEGGTLRVASDANLGAAAGSLSFNGGTLNTTSGFSSGRAVNLIGAGTLLIDASVTLSLSGAISGAGGLTKTGAGTLVLGGAGGYAGPTVVGAGALLVNGDFSAATGATSVASGATLGGGGTIGGDVTLADGAILTPGAGAPGTLTIAGDLALSTGSRLAFELGQANIAGGALNDLVNVGGDLVLDGAVDVSVPAGGGFGAGVYRVISYAGALTNNGLSVGALPTGAEAFVQTSVANQVNLVNTAGLTLNFWDGAAGPKNNGVINGGAGVWQAGGGNDNWTEAAGAVNAPYSDGAFAIFGGTGGAVTVDNSLGGVTAAGLQFAANGYTITGGGVLLSGAQSTVRVGDGTTAGAGFTATIASALGGSAQLVKTDAGTLVLGGDNTYAGGTLISGGTLQISSDANLGAATGGVTLDGGALATSASLATTRGVSVASGGAISTASGTTLTLNGALSGGGALTKAGAGVLRLTSDSGGYAGVVTVSAGTLSVGGVLGGAMNVGADARMEGSGRVGSLINSGVVAPGGDGLGVLTLAGDYVGADGVLEIETVLGGDASETDRLVVNGGVSETTEMVVTNRGGLGGQTVEGVKVVDVTGASTGQFTLRGDYVFEGSPAVVAGAYGYRLYQGGVSTTADGDWYLRSTLLDGTGQPQIPLYQPGVPLFESYTQALQTLNGLPTLQERVGNRQWAVSASGAPNGVWGRIEGARLRADPRLTTSAADLDIDSWKVQVGLDQTLSDREDGTLVGALTVHYGEADATVGSRFGSGRLDAKAYGLGATLTWYGSNGVYADGQAQLSWFDGRLRSSVVGELVDGNDGRGQAVSLELGQRRPAGDKLTVTPQFQVVYANTKFDAFSDPFGAWVSADKGDSLKTRWGLSVDRQDTSEGPDGPRRSHVYGVVSVIYEWLGGSRTKVSGTTLERAQERVWGTLGLGGSLEVGRRVTLYGQATADTPFADFGRSYGLKGVVGARLAF